MKPIHTVRFPRYDVDIDSERRTLVHLPIDREPWTVGSGLLLKEQANRPRCKAAVLVDARWVKLLAELDADLPKLCAGDRAEYIARWDALHPSMPAASNPVVWRIEFRYGMWELDPTDPPEWSLAA